MKKVTLIMGALALVLGLSQCKKPNAPTINGGNGTQHVVLQASLDNGGSKIAEDGNGGIKWAVNDQIAVKQGEALLGTLTCTDAENGIFTGDIATTSGDITFTFGKQNFESQTGTLDGAISLSSGDVAYNPSGSYTDVQMTMPYAVLKLDLSKVNMPVSEGNGTVVVSDGTTNATVTFPVANSGEVYVAMPANSTPTEYTFNGYGMCKKWTLDASTFYTKDGGGKDGTGAAIAVDPEWIDFGETGLPKFALKNLGATNGETAQSWYGDYYAWGEVAPYYTSINWTSATNGSVAGWKTDMTTGAGNNDLTSGYAWKSYSQGASNSFVEWSTKPYGSVNVLLPEYDAACQNTSSADHWRMPTGGEGGEWVQLASNTYFKWEFNYSGITGLNGFVVYKVKDEEDKGLMKIFDGISWETLRSGIEPAVLKGAYTASDPHMFLPAACMFKEKGLYTREGFNGCYWSSSINQYNQYCAMNMFFSSEVVGSQNSIGRCYGLTVRPVRPVQ